MFAKDQAQTPVPSNLARSNTALLGPNHYTTPVPHSRRASGNQAAQRVLQDNGEAARPELVGTASSRFGHDFSRLPVHSPASRAIQTKLAHNEPGDTYEKEADRVADQLLTTPVRHAASGARPHIQRLGGQTNGDAEAVPASVDEALAGPGRSLEQTLRRDMEQRLGHDFSQVRVHADATAEQSARDVNARAYTLGYDIVFGAGGFKPETHEGQRLIAHELTHVVQQTGGRADGVVEGHANTIMRETGSPPSGEQQEDGPPDWVRSIIGDRTLSLTTKLRAMAMGIGFTEFEPKGEDEFIKDLLAKQASEPAPDQPGLSSDEAAKQLTEQFTRNRAVDKAKSLMGADWHAAADSEAFKKAQSLHKGDPQDARSKALTGGMVWVYENQDAILKIKEEALSRYNKKKSPKALEMVEAADSLLTGIATSLNKSPAEQQQQSLGDASFAEDAWKYLGSEKSKKYLEKVGFPLAWFTTCVTLVNPVAEAAGVDTKKWGPLDMFDKRRQERFKEAQQSQAWVPAEKQEQPKPGDIIISVTYQKDQKGVVQKEISKATFQHVGILVEPVAKNPDGTERWVTADGGKGLSHKGEDKTGTTERRYNPNTQQFITGTQTNLQEAAEGGRYLLGFWSIIRLPKRAETPDKKDAKASAKPSAY